MKNLLVIIIVAIAVFNTLLGVVIDGYEMDSCMLVNFSLAITAGLLYWLLASKIADALKIAITMLFFITGLVRAALMVSSLSNAIFFIGIILFELVIMAIAYYNTSK